MPVLSIVYESDNRSFAARIDAGRPKNWIVTFLKTGSRDIELGYTIRKGLTSAQGAARAFCESGELNEKDPNLVKSGRR